MTQTSRQRVQAVLNGEIPDRVPFNFWMDRDKMAELDAKFGTDFRLTHYGVDVIEAFVGLPWWENLPMQTIDDGKTVWQTAPLVDSLEEALKLDLPSVDDPRLLADIRVKRSNHPDKAIFALMLAPLDILSPLRMPENLYMDIYDYPDEMHAMLDKIRPVLEEAAEKVCKEDIDVLYLAGDLCSRNGPLISPAALREFMFDYIRDVIGIAHKHGKKVFYHSDGFLFPILDIHVEYGVDGLNPLEPRFHDSDEFVGRWGDKLILYGGLDNCDIIPNSAPDEVRGFVRKQFETIGAKGRLIFSSHDIPSYCPQENLDAMVDEIKSCRYVI